MTHNYKYHLKVVKILAFPVFLAVGTAFLLLGLYLVHSMLLTAYAFFMLWMTWEIQKYTDRLLVEAAINEVGNRKSRTVKVFWPGRWEYKLVEKLPLWRVRYYYVAAVNQNGKRFTWTKELFCLEIGSESFTNDFLNLAATNEVAAQKLYKEIEYRKVAAWVQNSHAEKAQQAAEPVAELLS